MFPVGHKNIGPSARLALSWFSRWILRLVDYETLWTVVRGSDGSQVRQMDPVHRALLRTHRLELSGQLLVSDTIVPFLYQENILTEAQVEDIESQPTNRQKSLRLLDILPSRGPRAFDSFLRSLEEFSWVRDKLLLELQTTPGSGSTGEPTQQLFVQPHHIWLTDRCAQTSLTWTGSTRRP